MIKALLSFSLGGLVVFVPQGVKTQEKKPTSVREVQVVVLDDVTETAPESALVDLEVIELPAGLAVLSQDPKAHPVKIVGKDGLLGRFLQDPASQTELLHLLQRLEAMSVKVESLDGHVRQMDLARDVYSKGRNGLPGKYLGQDQARKLKELERKMKEIAAMRDRLEAQIETTRRAIGKAKVKSDAAAWQYNVYKDGKLVERNQVRKDHANNVNEARKRQMERDLLVAARGQADFTTQAAKALGVKVDLARVQEHAAAQQKTKRNDQVINKLEREVSRLTRELQRMNATKGSRTGTWSATSPRRTTVRTNPFGARTAPAPRASATQARRYPTRATTYRRRPSPSTLGAEGKVIWNEMQSIRSDIHSLRLMLERHIKANAPRSRSGSVGRTGAARGSVGGPLRGRIVTPQGVPVGPSTFGVTTVGPRAGIIVEDPRATKSSKGVRYFWSSKLPGPGTAPKSSKSGVTSERVEYLPLPAAVEEMKGGLRWEYKIHGEHDKAPVKKKRKSTKKRGSVVSWPAPTETPAAPKRRGSEIRRL